MLHNKPRELSVVIPAYNAAEWLPKSVPRVAAAAREAGLKSVEIIIVDDGSSDGTARIASNLNTGYPVVVISQPNSGRFAARANGSQIAKHDLILFIDTRVFLDKGALKYVLNKMDSNNKAVWSSHVHIDKQSNIFARFWEALTFVAWRRYFANPRDCSYGAKDFDYYPKGTTCFLAPKQIIVEANDWFKRRNTAAKAVNDDTVLIRHIAETHRINLSPKFSCVYHARTGLMKYSSHVYHRGKVFVDGFLHPGNRFFWPLIGFLIISPVILVALIEYPSYIVPLLFLFAVGWLAELVTAVLIKVPTKDALSLFVLTPLFVLLYGAGIWAAIFDHLHKQPVN